MAVAFRTAEYETLRKRCFDRLVAEGALHEVPERDRPVVIEGLVSQYLFEFRASLPRDVRERLITEIQQDVLGYGPITPLLEDDGITEIMVNGPGQVYVERDGRLVLTDIRFRDDEHVMRVIERIVSPLGRRIDESSPMVDARLPDGSRVNAIIPPISLVGPVLTVRKFVRKRLDAAELVRLGALTHPMVEFLRLAVRGRLNILVSGGTSSGKTTILNMLSTFIPPEERIISIEDTAELQLQHPHWIRLETRPPNIEGRGEVTARDLVRNALRMRPDRIIVGEVRGAEAFEMVQAMNTGHEGGMSTIHANTAEDALVKLGNYMRYTGMDISTEVINTQIASAVHLVIHVHRFPDGARRVTGITELVENRGERIETRTLWTFRRNDDGSGTHVWCGEHPKLAAVLAERGIRVPKEVFC